jgi:hypothetical protein
VDIGSTRPRRGRALRGVTPVVVSEPGEGAARHRDVNLFGAMNLQQGMLFARAHRGTMDTDVVAPIIEAFLVRCGGLGGRGARVCVCACGAVGMRVSRVCARMSVFAAAAFDGG